MKIHAITKREVYGKWDIVRFSEVLAESKN